MPQQNAAYRNEDNEKRDASPILEPGEWKDQRVYKEFAVADLNLSKRCFKEKALLFNCLEVNVKDVGECQNLMDDMNDCQLNYS